MPEATAGEVAALFNVLKAGEVLADISTAATDIVELLEEAQKDRGKQAGEVIAAAISTALKEALAGMPPPTVSVPVPTVTVTGQKDWTSMDCTPDYDHTGRLNKLTFKRY